MTTDIHKPRAPKPIIFLCNIRSAQNSGAIMRTADAIGAGEIIFGGYTPGPQDRFGRPRKEFTKSSLGSEQNVPWRQTDDCISTLRTLKKQGAYLIAVEQSPHAANYKTVHVPRQRQAVVVLGNEVTGIPPDVCEMSDTVIEIPMHGKKESLNVSVAAGVVLFRLFDL